MTSDETPQDPYGGTPYYGPPATQPGYGQQVSPYGGQPGYGYPQYGPPQYGQPYPYQPYPPQYPPAGPGRPGTVTASAVLAFVAGGLLLAAALLLFAGASLLNDFGNATETNTDPTTTEFSLDGILNLVCAALLIAGGVMITGRKHAGRTMICTGGAIVVAAAIYWLARFSDFGATIFYALLFGALAVISMALAFTETARAWLGAPPAKASPTPS